MVSFARAERFLFDLENIILDGIPLQNACRLNPSNGPVPRNLEDGFEGVEKLLEIACSDRLKLSVRVCLAPKILEGHVWVRMQVCHGCLRVLDGSECQISLTLM
jgi:hypothetical protein